MRSIEREFKWTVETEQDFESFLSALTSVLGVVPALKEVKISDAYLENSTGTLSAEKVALRIRQMDNSWEATLKTRTRLTDGLACRKELTLPLPPVQDVNQALSELKKKKEWDGIKLTDLWVKFEIKNDRQIYEFAYKSSQCQAALDRYCIYAAADTLPCREIELELKEGKMEDFMKIISLLTKKSGLKAAQISKVATAEKMLKR